MVRYGRAMRMIETARFCDVAFLRNCILFQAISFLCMHVSWAGGTLSSGAAPSSARAPKFILHIVVSPLVRQLSHSMPCIQMPVPNDWSHLWNSFWAPPGRVKTKRSEYIVSIEQVVWWATLSIKTMQEKETS